MLIERPIERTLAVVGLTGVALIHLLDLHDTFLGLASLFVEGAVVALGLGVLAGRLPAAVVAQRAVPAGVSAR